MKDGDRIVSLKEVARILGNVSLRTVQRMIAAGLLPQPISVCPSGKKKGLLHSAVSRYVEGRG